jgi:serine/threonine protein kinase
MSRRFGQYELTRRLGAGGMGEVWGAVKVGTVGGVKMPCAIKLMRAEFAETEADRERFLNEARIAAQLDHGRIVKVIDVGEIAGTLYLVMDRVDGVDLRTFLAKFTEAGGTKLSQHVAVFIVAEILAALSYAHNRTISGKSAAVIHHDVTPGNILVSSSGEVKLTDFGISRFAATAGRVSRPMGTVRYMAPEMMLGDYGRPASDIYQLGVILHELLDGRRYLADSDAVSFQRLVMSGPPAPLIQKDVPQWLNQLREGMLANDPLQRPSSRAALNLILRNSSAHAGAGEELRQLYEQLIGDSRSGFTEFLRAVRDDPDESGNVPGLVKSEIQPTVADPPPLEASAEVRSEPAWWNRQDSADAPRTQTEPVGPEQASTTGALEKTEVLSATFAEPEAGRPMPVEQAVSTSTAVQVVSVPPSRAPGSRPLMIGLALTIGLLLVTVAIMSWKLVGTPEPQAQATDVGPSLPNDTVPSEAESVVVASPKPPKVESEPKPAPVIEAPPTEPTPVVDPAAAAQEPAPAETQTNPEPEPKATSKPKQPAPKMAVVLSVDKVKEGEIKIRSKVHPYKYSATVWLATGRHTVSWRAAGKTDWTSAGTLVVEDIGTDTYSVVLRDGSLDRKRNVRNKH